jgi:hypothetical protein
VIIEILGKRGEPGVDTLSIIREFNLPGDFQKPFWRTPANRRKSSTRTTSSTARI